MRRLRYRLVVLTHGDSETLVKTLKSYAQNVQPPPVERVIVYDGEELPDHVLEVARQIGGVAHATGGLGFCGATARAWEEGIGRVTIASPLYSPPDFSFHLEHDFVFRRAVDLEPITFLLDGDRQLAQVSLMRNAVNDVEIAAGGVLSALKGHEFERRIFTRAVPTQIRGVTVFENVEMPYLVHSSYLTTNPSFMRRQFMQENPWPEYSKECEGRFGIDLVARGYRFAVWGEGNPWVDHIGQRSGHSY